MNQRSRNCRRHAAVLIDQLVERRNGRRVAQNHGDLTATGHAGGLALGAGLGFHSVRQSFSIKAANVGCAAVSNLTRRPTAMWLAILANDEGSVCFSCDRDGGEQLGDFFGGLDFHDLLQNGLIPPMCESYAVTSDNARDICA